MAPFLEYLAALLHIRFDILEYLRDFLHHTNAIRIFPRFPDLIHHHAVHLFQLFHAEPAGTDDDFAEKVFDEGRIDDRLRGRAIRVEYRVYGVGPVGCLYPRLILGS